MAIHPVDRALINAGVPQPTREDPTMEAPAVYGTPVDAQLNTHREVANRTYARTIQALRARRAETMESLRRNTWRVGGAGVLLALAGMTYGAVTGHTPVEVINQVSGVFKDGFQFVKDQIGKLKIEPLFDIGNEAQGVKGGPVYSGSKDLFTTIGMENPTQAAHDFTDTVGKPFVAILGNKGLADNTDYDAAGSWAPVAGAIAIPAAAVAAYRGLAPIARRAMNVVIPNRPVRQLRRYENQQLNEQYDAAIAAGDAGLAMDINAVRANLGRRLQHIQDHAAAIAA